MLHKYHYQMAFLIPSSEQNYCKKISSLPVTDMILKWNTNFIQIPNYLSH